MLYADPIAKTISRVQIIFVRTCGGSSTMILSTKRCMATSKLLRLGACKNIFCYPRYMTFIFVATTVLIYRNWRELKLDFRNPCSFVGEVVERNSTKLVHAEVAHSNLIGISIYIDGVEYRKLVKPNAYSVECFASVDDQFCLPSWAILGSWKAGSSALWQYICDNVDSHCSHKEIHYNGEPLIPYIKKMMGQNAKYGSGNVGYIEFLPPIQDFFEKYGETKFIIILRNPIDWIFGAWHYWCNSNYDGRDCVSGTLVSEAPNATARTPENFEQLVKSYCIHGKECPFPFSDGFTSWAAVEPFLPRIAPERLLIIRSEELARNTSQTMSKLWNFLGLSTQLRNPDILGKAFNTGSNNGVKSHERIDNALGRSYKQMTQVSITMLCKLNDYWNNIKHFSEALDLPLSEYDLSVCPTSRSAA